MTTAEDLGVLIAEQNAVFLDRRPRKYRAAVADDPGVVAWIDQYEANLPGDPRRRLTQRPHANSLFVFGGPGSGKTHQALGVPATLAQRGVPVRFSFVRAVDYLDAQQNAGFAEKESRFADARDSRLLILDDLFSGADHRRSASDLYRLLDARFSAEHPTILTCNLAGDALREALGPRLADRLREDCVMVKIDNPSRREFRPVTPE